MLRNNKTLKRPNPTGKDNTGRPNNAGNKSLLSVLKSANYYSYYIIFLLLGFCTLFYYFGELVDFAGWESLRWGFLYGVHDVHRLLFLAPILYAAYVFGGKATAIITIVSLMIFLPRAIFHSPFPDPIMRMVLFIIIAGTMGHLMALTRRESKKRRHLESLIRSERDTILEILERMDQGVLIVAPDYSIRYMNKVMIRDFGDYVGSRCFECLFKSSEPCRDICKLADVVNGSAEKWEYKFLDGKIYEVVASPYVDLDGTVCQLTTLVNITQLEKGA